VGRMINVILNIVLILVILAYGITEIISIKWNKANIKSNEQLIKSNEELRNATDIGIVKLENEIFKLKEKRKETLKKISNIATSTHRIIPNKDVYSLREGKEYKVIDWDMDYLDVSFKVLDDEGKEIWISDWDCSEYLLRPYREVYPR
jgi:hypothetical protein